MQEEREWTLSGPMWDFRYFGGTSEVLCFTSKGLDEGGGRLWRCSNALSNVQV